MLAGSPISADSPKLASAAEDLIKAACSHVESASLTIGRETVETLKKLASDSSSIDKSVGTLTTVHDAKMDALIKSFTEFKQEINQSISELNDKMSELNVSVTNQTKEQTLAWAISNAGVNSFKYYKKDSNHDVDSTELVKNILLSFRQEYGHYITNCSKTRYNAGEVEAGEKQFRDALSKQVHQLIGQKPRIDMAKDGYAIYYS